MHLEDDEPPEWLPESCYHPLYLMWRGELREPWQTPEPLSYAEFWSRDLPDLPWAD
jgi:hypothetical protein